MRIQKADAKAILTLEDNGPGIPIADRQRVFDRFVRLGSNENEGSGIGLAIVKKIVALHHAKIELDTPSHPGLIIRVIFTSQTA